MQNLDNEMNLMNHIGEKKEHIAFQQTTTLLLRHRLLATSFSLLVGMVVHHVAKIHVLYNSPYSHDFFSSLSRLSIFMGLLLLAERTYKVFFAG
jgi:hypothetical protein